MPLFTIALAAVAVASQASHLYVLEQGTAQFDQAAGALALTDVPTVAAATLGVSLAGNEFLWTGLRVGDIFSRPSATATIIVDGVSSLPVKDGTASFLLTHDELDTASGIRAIVTGDSQKGLPALSSVISERLGSGSSTLSVCANEQLAKIAGHRDLDNAKEHTVHAADPGFVDDATNTEPLQIAKFTPAFLNGASYDPASRIVSYSGVVYRTVDLPFFQELHAMTAAVSAMSGTETSAPAVLTFTVSTYAALVARYGDQSPAGLAAQKALAATVASISSSLSSLYNGRAVVMAVALESSEATVHKNGLYAHAKGAFSMAEFIGVHETRQGRARRGVNTESVYGVTSFANSSNYTQVQDCALDGYKCQCWKAYAPDSDFHEQPWQKDGKDNGGKPGCLFQNKAKTSDGMCYTKEGDENTKIACNKVCFDIASLCPCTDPNFDASFLYAAQLKKYVCEKCKTGFLCENGQCYVETSFTAVFNGALWLGLATTAGFFGVWVSLHTISDKPPGAALKGGLLDGGAEAFAKKMM